MKKAEYNNFICKPFCSFYKEGKDSIACGGYELLKNHITLPELKLLAGHIAVNEEIPKQIPTENKMLAELICKHCDFLIDGCDYAENRSGPPCGGYILIEKLIQITTLR
jgi:hypothetical protein